MRKISLTIILTALSGCAAVNQPPLLPANPVIKKMHVIPNRTHYHLHYGNNPALEHAFNQYLKTGRAPNIETQGFIKFAYSGDQQPVIQTTPLQETVISLEPGERFTDVTTGDPSRWQYAAAISGSGTGIQQHILVKPSQSGISTNMVITTDKRIYNLRLVSTNDATLSRAVSFWYPEELVNKANQTDKLNEQSVATHIDVNHLNFDYRIGSSIAGFFNKPSWQPTRVFDDGKHTYICFPSNIGTRDMPALFVDGHSLVNYRYQVPYFVVDRLFKQAVLVMGVGIHEQRVTITNEKY